MSSTQAPPGVDESTYRDHGQVTREMVLRAEDGSSSERPRAKGGVTTAFPVKLHDMLRQIEECGHAHVVSWQPHGRSFKIHKPDAFVRHILPTYFRQSKFTSFSRQLNMYGFSRMTAGRDKGCYYHEMFLKGREFLVSLMSRVAVKGTGVRKPGRPHAEPDFYSMPPVSDAPPAGEKAMQPMASATRQAPRLDNDKTTEEKATMQNASVASFQSTQHRPSAQISVMAKSSSHSAKMPSLERSADHPPRHPQSIKMGQDRSQLMKLSVNQACKSDNDDAVEEYRRAQNALFSSARSMPSGTATSVATQLNNQGHSADMQSLANVAALAVEEYKRIQNNASVASFSSAQQMPSTDTNAVASQVIGQELLAEIEESLGNAAAPTRDHKRTTSIASCFDDDDGQSVGVISANEIQALLSDFDMPDVPVDIDEVETMDEGTAFGLLLGDII